MRTAKTQEQLDKILKEYGECEIRNGIYIVTSGNVTARENSQVTARGNSQVTAWENSQVTAWGMALAIQRSPFAMVNGNKYVIEYPKSIIGWCERNGIAVSNGKFIVYKATDTDYCTRNGFKYIIGEQIIDPAWNSSTDIECGQGLHFCYDPIACEQFNNKPGHYLKCEVSVKDVAFYSRTPTYPDKIRAKQCYVICEVDRNGKPIEQEDK